MEVNLTVQGGTPCRKRLTLRVGQKEAQCPLPITVAGHGITGLPPDATSAAMVRAGFICYEIDSYWRTTIKG